MPENTAPLSPADICAMRLADLPSLASSHTSQQLDDASRQLDSVAGDAAFRAAYLGYRAGPCGSDQGHDAALRHANKVCRRVRRALGYYTTHDATFAGEE